MTHVGRGVSMRDLRSASSLVFATIILVGGLARLEGASSKKSNASRRANVGSTIPAAAPSPAAAGPSGGQPAAPSDARLLQPDNLVYLGAFRVPDASSDDSAGFSFGGGPIAYNPNNNSLFIGSIDNLIAEVSIPTPVVSDNPADMPFAALLQPLADPTEGQLNDLSGGDLINLGG